MDVLIKNMEMPRFETKRLALFPDGRVAEIKGYDFFLVEAKAIELRPHGDLKDEKVIKDVILKKLGIRSLDLLFEAEKVIVKCVEQAPTVLEANA